METHTPDTGGTLDEALQRLHRTGPELQGWLSNHAPMAVEALVRHGQAAAVHRWLDRYEDLLEEMPERLTPVTDADWREALGDPRRLADWIDYFRIALENRPWREVLAVWWPRLLPGISAAATHPVIRVGHAVRTLLDDEATGHGGSGQRPGPRLAELAHALGYWAARHQPLTGITALPAAPSAAAGLDAVPRIGDQSGGIRARLARISELPAPPGGPDSAEPDRARERLAELVRAATHRYATHGHGNAVMLVHAATAPNAVLRTLPALPRALWAASLEAAWSASAAVTAAYAPAAPEPPSERSGEGATAEEVFAWAATHGDAHAVKFTDTALDVAAAGEPGDIRALAAAQRALSLIDPME